MTALHIPLVLLMFGAGDLREHLPPQLQQVIQSRRAKTSQIDWTVTWYGGVDDGMVERFITRTAGETVWQSNPGDEDGFHYRGNIVGEDGKLVPKEAMRGTRNRLIFEERVWSLMNAERPASGWVESPESAYPPVLPLDFTAAGLAPRWVPYDYRTPLGLDRKRYYDGFDSAVYSSFRRGAIESIVADFGDRQVEWDLDHSRGNQPVRAAYYKGDKLLYQSETELTQTDGRWFPSRMWFFNDDLSAPTHVIEVKEATFDKPWHMQQIGPEDIGVLFGTQFAVPGAPVDSHGDDAMVWDGTRLLSAPEYRVLHYIYGIDPDPRITKMLAEPHLSVEEYQQWVDRAREAARDEYYKEHGQAPWLVQRWKERDEWDVYVEEFIKKHGIDGARADRAQYLLRRAKQLRDYQKGKTDDRITKARRDNEYAKVAHFQEAGEKRTKEIFDQLVRGLEALVPKKDRKADAKPSAEPPE